MPHWELVEMVTGPSFRATSRGLIGSMHRKTTEDPAVLADSGPAGLTEAPNLESLNVSCCSLVVRSKRVGPREP